MSEQAKKQLVLHVAVPDIYADDFQQWADDECDGDVGMVIEEEIRSEVGITIITLPGEKELNSDFTVTAHVGLIVGAETRDSPS